MIPAFCINLDRRPDRQAHMQAQFARIGLVAERLAATDGQDPAVAAALAARHGGGRLSAGAMACFDSHRRIWAMLAAGRAPQAIVLEDDLLLAPPLAAIQRAGLPAGADLVKIETNGTRVHLARGPGLAADAADPGRRLVPLRSFHSGAGGYIVSARLAGRLLALSERSREPVDDFLFDRAGRGSFPILQMVPAPVAQGASRPAQAAGASGGWTATSITEHWAPGAADPSDRRETPPARLLRRLREEARALRHGTRYVTVPWG